MSNLDTLAISNRFSELPSSFYTRLAPQPLTNSQWVIWNKTLADLLQFPDDVDSLSRWLPKLDGSALHQGFEPLAMKYAGHQFGGYNPELGDGRGLLLGEIEGKDKCVYDVHLKGAGITPYSRMGDGRAVLRSSIREYLCSEALFALNIPTTRALGLIASDTPVYREKQEKGAMLIRIAETHIRFGHFEHFFYTNQHRELKLLADKVIEWHFPDLANSKTPYVDWFHQVVKSTAEMIAHWQAIGFAHGVMNTDNMSILGQTFDFGPFGFIDDFEAGYICNHSDYHGRYAFNQQPNIGLWNLSALAYALSPLIEKEDAESALDQYESILSRKYYQLMRNKLGLRMPHEHDGALIESLLLLLEEQRIDYTNFFRYLSNMGTLGNEPICALFCSVDAIQPWLKQYFERLELESKVESGEVLTMQQRCEVMRTHNPKYILRNYLVQQAIERAEEGDFSEVHRLASLLTKPFDEQPEYEKYASLPPEWGKKLEISCSS
ncbi:YdiU family protein [Vibrio sp. S4M6]|uniref:protein adenylyltransferase SelO n=1 Tax=Vibrio sinus TaxID=2946865 RepID=UPI00202A9AAD|nr:YdiU family protein [Vibrio sinus]MCL9783051.1 YdiU family protein [Vibrio sinus]